MSRSPQDGVRRSRAGIWLAVLVLLAALASALLAGGARSASQPQGLIAFTRDDGIYVMRPDGTGVRRIRLIETWDVAWSPDGRTLAFAAQDTICVIDADGRNLVRFVLAEGVTGAGSPTWSPDGREIAFTAYHQGDRDRDIWMMNADGSEQRLLVRTPGLFEVEVDWSPSGEKLAVASDGYFPRVWIMSADGTNRQRLTRRGFEAFEPEWSPNGRRIAFTGDQGNGYDIFVTALDGRAAIRLTANFAVPDRSSTWSPDGRRIAFTRVTGTSDRSQEIYIMNADGTGAKRLTKNKVAERSPAWQPYSAP